MGDVKEELAELKEQAADLEASIRDGFDLLLARAATVGGEIEGRISDLSEELRAQVAELKGKIEGIKG